MNAHHPLTQPPFKRPARRPGWVAGRAGPAAGPKQQASPIAWQTRSVFVVLVTGPPGAGKTVTLTALSDALVEAAVPHASGDVDELAWAYPFPDLPQRCAHLRDWCDSHRRAGRTLLLVAEVIESPAHLSDVLAALGADDHLLVRLEAEPATLRRRIVAREPEGWFGLEYLLNEMEQLHLSMAGLDGVHLVLDTERLTAPQITEAIRAARPDELGPGAEDDEELQAVMMSSAMPDEAIEVVRAVWEAFVRMDFPADAFDDEVRWHTASDLPDAGTVRGPAAVANMLAEGWATVTEPELWVEGIAAVGELIVVGWGARGQGRASGIAAEWREAHVYRVRGGLVAEVWEFRDHDEALKAAEALAHQV